MKWMYNNQVIDEDELVIPAKDHGFLYGVGLFETFRVYNRIPFLFEEHIYRLQEGLNIIGIDIRLDITNLYQQLDELLTENKIKDAYIRLTVSAGEAPLGLPTKKYTNPSYLWQMKELKPINEETLTFKNAVLLRLRRNTPEAEHRLKSLNFLNNVLAKQETNHLENTEGIFLSQDGFIAEGIVSNIFFTKEDTVYTPSIKTGILTGITRQHIIGLCKENGITVEEGLFLPEDMYKANEIFITNSINGVVSVNKLEKMTFKYSEKGITNFLFNKYRESIIALIADKRGQNCNETQYAFGSSQKSSRTKKRNAVNRCR